MSRSAHAQARLPDLLIRNRNFVLLWLAYGISAIGDHLSEMALLTERDALERPDATRVRALMQFGFFLPFVLFGPFAGWWADRFSRKSTMILADLLRAGVVLSLTWTVPLLVGWGFEDYSIMLPLFVTGALAAFFSPCRQALVPELVRDDQLVRANSFISALGTVGTIISAVVGGYLVANYGPNWNYRLDAVTFTLSALCVGAIVMTHARPSAAGRPQGVWTPLKEGVRYITSHRRVLQIILVGTVFWAAAGVIYSIIPALVRDVFKGSIEDVGTYQGLVVVGIAIGAAIMSWVGPAMPVEIAIMGSLLGGGVWILVLDAGYLLGFGSIFAGVCLVIIGAHGAALLVTVMATIQRLVPNSRRGRVFGVADMSTMGAMVLATGLLGIPNIPRLDSYIPWLLLLTGGGMSAAAVVAWHVYRRGSPYGAAIWLIWRLVRLYVNVWCRLRRDGPCTVPRSGGVILAANHTSGLDPLCIYGTCRYRVVSFLVEKKYYDLPVANWFQKLVGCIPIDRANPGKSTIANVLRLLRDGGCLGIFPQGTFERPEENVEGKTGVAMFALRSGATVIPCHISGTRYFDSVFASYLFRQSVRVRYGPPVDLSAYQGRTRDKQAVEEASELIMRKIRELAPPTEPQG